MKRFLLLFCSVVLICAIMIVPVLAAEDVLVLDADLFAYVPERFSGDFVARFYNRSGELFWTTPAFTVEAQSEFEKCFEFVGAGPASEDICLCSAFQENTDSYEFCLYINFSDNGDMFMDRYNYSRVELVPVETGSDAEASPIGSVFDVFGGVGSWIGSQLGSTTSLFWNASTGSLTFLGVLSVCALALSVILLLVFLVVRFLQFRG